MKGDFSQQWYYSWHFWGSYILCRTICLVKYMKHHRQNYYRSSSCLSRASGESHPWGFSASLWEQMALERTAWSALSRSALQPSTRWPFPGSPGSGDWPGRVGRNKVPWVPAWVHENSPQEPPFSPPSWLREEHERSDMRAGTWVPSNWRKTSHGSGYAWAGNKLLSYSAIKNLSSFQEQLTWG